MKKSIFLEVSSCIVWYLYNMGYMGIIVLIKQ